MHLEDAPSAALSAPPAREREHQLCVVASALPIILLLTAPFRGNVPQSNMEYSVNKAFNASAEIADSIHYPDLRFVTFSARSAASYSPAAGEPWTFPTSKANSRGRVCHLNF